LPVFIATYRMNSVARVGRCFLEPSVVAPLHRLSHFAQSIGQGMRRLEIGAGDANSRAWSNKYGRRTETSA
jgi:hypothetical protein